ncbi:PREDICTED: uncharacterized protein LOC109476903 [Branchiostoma belcheri]|uniref:Uncharacterized protein LOC109476903 n=1 Tax=Branchiostoma belcheri TaxID=7741 RepID=A0A6P4ZHH7_BRABE|nr:PREDICTED: uncharacterized protein LOC109476903 [Branchiostoma belcheri]
MLRSRPMATTMSTEQSDDSVNVESMSRKLKNTGSEDDLEVGAEAMPKRAHRCSERKPERPPEPVAHNATIYMPGDQEATRTSTRNTQAGESDYDVRTIIYLRLLLTYDLPLGVRKMAGGKLHNDPGSRIILPEQFNVSHAAHHNRVSLKDQEVSELKARVADLQSEKTQESTEAAAKIKGLEERLVDQAANTRHRISQKEQEIASLKARVAKLEDEKKGCDEASPHMLSQTLQAENVLNDPRPIHQDIQKIKKGNDERMAHQQEMVAEAGSRKLWNQAEVPEKAENKVPDAEEHDETDMNAVEVSQITLNGISLPLSDALMILAMGDPLPLAPAEQHNKANKTPSEVPQILLNGDPLTLLHAEEQDEANKTPDEVPQILLNGDPLTLIDTEEQDEADKTPSEVPQILLNGVPLTMLDDEEQDEDTQKTSLSSGDANLGNNINAAQKQPHIPDAFEGLMSDSLYKEHLPSHRRSASPQEHSKVMRHEDMSGDMKPQSPGAPSSWWKPEKPSTYQEVGEPSMNLLDFTAADEPRGLECLIEKKAPHKFWCEPALVRGGKPRGLESVLDNSKDSQAVQQKAWQRCQLTNTLDLSSTNDMAAVSGKNMSHSTMSMQVNTSPANEGEDTVRDEPVALEPCFLLALLTHRIKRGYRLLSTVRH